MSRIGNYLASAGRNSQPVVPYIAQRQVLTGQLREAMGTLIRRDLDGWVIAQEYARRNSKEDTLVMVMRELERLDGLDEQDATTGLRAGMRG